MKGGEVKITRQRRWTNDCVFKRLEEKGFHPTDVEFGNGYFIFDYGEDKVVHFHIKELKGWKFGIWWNIKGKMKFDIFTQYERDIDKFKPSASTFAEKDCEIKIRSKSEMKYYDLDRFIDMCSFIKKHPFRAWKVDQGYAKNIWEWDECKHAFIEYVREWWHESVRQPWIYSRMNKKYLEIVHELADRYLEQPEIVDNNSDGWACYPRYTIRGKRFKGEPTLAQGRHYSFPIREIGDYDMGTKVQKYNELFKKYDDKGYHIDDIDLSEGEFEFFIKRKEK